MSDSQNQFSGSRREAPQLIALHSFRAQSGKSTVARRLSAEVGHIVLGFAEPLYDMLEALTAYDSFTPFRKRAKEEIVPLFGASPRRMLQTLGTEWGREAINPNIWVNIARRRIERDIGYGMVFDDLRFANEYTLIKELGGEVWLVNRPDAAEPNGHHSEGLLSGFQFDRVVNNMGTLHDLEENIKEALYRPNRSHPGYEGVRDDGYDKLSQGGLA